MGRGAMVAHRSLEPIILVRIQAPQPYRSKLNNYLFGENRQSLIAYIFLLSSVVRGKKRFEWAEEKAKNLGKTNCILTYIRA